MAPDGRSCMKKAIMMVLCGGALLMGIAGGADALNITNGDFSNGLESWTSQDTTVNNGMATLSDVNGWAYLYQGISSTPGQYKLIFDYKTSIPAVSDGAFSDLFSATIYMGSFDLTTDPLIFGDNIPLLDNTAGAVTLYNGNLTSLDDGWSRLTLAFNNPSNMIFVDFELFDLYDDNNSVVAIKNVSLTESAPVPEPSSLLLLAVGMSGGVILLGNRKKPA